MLAAETGWHPDTSPGERKWVSFILNLLCHEANVVESTKRLIYFDKGLDFHDWEGEYSFDNGLERLGYHPPSKMAQLMRNYYNEEQMERLFAGIKGRSDHKYPYTPLSAIMNNEVKRDDSLGFCMQSLVVTMVRVKETYTLDFTLFYRSTELIKKFGADLVFLEDLINECITHIDQNRWKVQVGTIRMRFATCFISTLFIPCLFQHYITPAAFLEMILANAKDRKLALKTLEWLYTMVTSPVDRWSFGSRIIVAKQLHALSEEDRQSIIDLRSKHSASIQKFSRGRKRAKA